MEKRDQNSPVTSFLLIRELTWEKRTEFVSIKRCRAVLILSNNSILKGLIIVLLQKCFQIINVFQEIRKIHIFLLAFSLPHTPIPTTPQWLPRFIGFCPNSESQDFPCMSVISCCSTWSSIKRKVTSNLSSCKDNLQTVRWRYLFLSIMSHLVWSTK